MASIWDPERLRIAGDILSRYSEHLAPGHRIRLTMEGDPCVPPSYRSSEGNERVATVSRVSRREDGFVEFDAIVDESQEVLHLDNRNVDPMKLWEINPDDMDAFRASIGLNDDESDDDDAKYAAARKQDDERYGRLANEIEDLRVEISEMSKLRSEIDELRRDASEFKNTFTDSLRMLSGDVLKAKRGEDVDFAGQFADRYDEAHLDPPVTSTSKQSEKYDFEFSEESASEIVEPTPVRFRASSSTGDLRESDMLTDEEAGHATTESRR